MAVKLQDLLQINSILIDFAASEKADVLHLMGRYMASLHSLSNPEGVVHALVQREADMSTGIGYGIAIPHARLDSIDKIYMCAARLAAPVDFNAIDDQPVDLVFMMLSPANTSSDHPGVLSALSRVMSYEDVRDGLRNAGDAPAFLHVLIQGENTYVG